MEHRDDAIEDLVQAIRRTLPALRTAYGVRSIGLFGSYVRGENRQDSDLDILVEFSKAPSFVGFMKLESYLSELTGKKVDLVSRKALKPRIGERILREVIYV